MLKNLIYHKFSILLLLSCVALYFSFGYDLERTDFIKLLSLYGALFFLSWKLFQLEKFNWKLVFSAGIIFRLIFLFSIPNLSQDFYRFIWDGKLLLNDINPYLFSPNELISDGNILFPLQNMLLNGMGSLSAGNHSNYPPLKQLFFAFAALFTEKGILGALIAFRLLIISAEVGIFYFGRKLLRDLNLPENNIFWYFLNPLIIIELSGNLHFEAVMLFFLLWSIYLLHKGKWIWSAVIFSCAVSIKLIPLLFLPLLWRFFQKRDPQESQNIWKLLLFYFIITFLTFISFLPFLDSDLFQNFLETTGLWFQKFEFNASVYYVIRWIGFQITGYNIIKTAGLILAGTTFFAVLALSFLRHNRNISGLICSMLFAISIYYFLATTVHPWYLATPLLLSIFTKYKFAMVWTAMAFLSYAAYSATNFQENYLLIALEYLVVVGFFLKEIFNRNILHEN